jgi:hypothetical protein
MFRIGEQQMGQTFKRDFHFPLPRGMRLSHSGSGSASRHISSQPIATWLLVSLMLFLPADCVSQQVKDRAAAKKAPRLTVGRNPHFFEYAGRPVALFGSGLWTIIPDTTIDIEDHNAWYAKYRSNANRATLFAFCTSVADGRGIAPWRRVDGHGLARDGYAKFDLNQPNEKFWQRAHRYLRDCEKRGIFVLLQMFDEPFTEAGDDRWAKNPFNPDNHINNIPGLPRGSGSGEAAFYDPDNSHLMPYLDALITRLLDETAQRYGHIIYEIGNEYNMDSATPKEVAWQKHWIDLFQEYERQHDVSLLLTNDTRAELIAAGADSFPVINDHGLPLPHGNNVTWEDIWRRVSGDYARFERPIINSRPRSDPDRKKYNDIVTEEKGREIFWAYLASGGHVIGFRTTEASWKDGLAAERIVQGIHTFLDTTEFAKLVPHRELVDQGLCLANPGYEYVVYLPDGGDVRVDLSAIEGEKQLPVVAYDPTRFEFHDIGTHGNSKSAKFTMPHKESGRDWVLHIGNGGGPWPEAAKRMRFTAVEDFFVNRSEPEKSFGDQTNVQVGKNRVAFITFDLGDWQRLVRDHGVPRQAVLRLNTTNGSRQSGGTLFLATADEVHENSVTWSEKPQMKGPALAQLGPVSIGAAYELNVLPALRGQSRIRFAIRSTSEDGAAYGSRESGMPPVLELRFD